MTEEQLREYEALAGVAVDADADECESAWAIDALVAEVRRLQAENDENLRMREANASSLKHATEVIAELRADRGRCIHDWREAYGRIQARETHLERELRRLRSEVDHLEGWKEGAENVAEINRRDLEWWQTSAGEWEDEATRLRQALQEVRGLTREPDATLFDIDRVANAALEGLE